MHTVVLGPSSTVSHIFHSQFVILSCPSRGPHGKTGSLIGFLPRWADGGAPSRFFPLNVVCCVCCDSGKCVVCRPMSDGWNLIIFIFSSCPFWLFFFFFYFFCWLVGRRHRFRVFLFHFVLALGGFSSRCCDD